MLENIVKDVETSPFVVIIDSVKSTGTDLLLAFVQARLLQPGHVVHYVTLDRRAACRFDRLTSKENFCVHDGSKDPTGLLNLTVPVTSQTNLAQYASNVHNDGTVTVVVDSLDFYLLSQDLASVCQSLHKIAQDTKVHQLICLLHKDCHDENTTAALSHLARTVICVDSPGHCTLTHKKPGGKIVTEMEEFTISEKFDIEAHPVKKLPVKMNPGDNSDEKISKLATFKLTLGDKDKEDRKNLVLPYLKNTKGAISQIYYQPDDADDWDEEDPDDDLDI